MKLPKEIKVGAHTYKVIFPYQFRERTDLSGHHLGGSMELRISDVDTFGTPASDSRILEVFLHEVFHAINATYCMEMLGKEIDVEKLIEALSEGVAQILVDNGYVKLT